MNTYFGFKNRKLVTVVQTTEDCFDCAIDMDYVISNPQDAEKQIAEWKLGK